MALSELAPGPRHRAITAAFTDRVDAVKHWDVPTPVPEWRARDVVRHLVEWSGAFLASGADLKPPETAPVDEDPVGAWQTHRDWVQSLLDRPEDADRPFTNPHIGELPLELAIDRFYTSDVFMHTWDLARATGQDDRLDPDQCAVLLDGMAQFEDAIRGSGQYGPRVAVAEGADPQTRLLGFIGRDPTWTPDPR